MAEIALENTQANAEYNMGVREVGSGRTRFLRLHEAEDGGADYGRMHVATDGDAAIEFLHEDVSQSHDFLLVGYWTIPGPKLRDHAAGQEPDAFSESGSETDAELFAFKLVNDVGPTTVTQVVFRLSEVDGLADGDWAGIEIRVDADGNGSIGPGETTTVGGAGVVSTAAGTLTFSTSFNVTAATNYILRADFASLSDWDAVTIDLSPGDITAGDTFTGSCVLATHREGCFYVASGRTWEATTGGSWQVKDLSRSPYNVPANAVVEVAVENVRANAERWGGVRAEGSALDRRLRLHEAEGGGADLLVMHVQANGSSEIEHYAENTTDVTFTLLGFWDCGTYVERFDSFAAGASGSWQDVNLSGYGVGSYDVAEIVVVNTDTGNEREAGARANGPTHDRTLTLHEAEAGGVDTATLCVRADGSVSATIEVYAQDNADITFYHVGYWSTPPKDTYDESIVDVGSPAADATWEDKDLGGFDVPGRAVAEFVLANATSGGENEMGLRRNGSSRVRVLDIHESEGGGSDFGRMHVLSDSASIVEFYHEDVSDAHVFRLVGYWYDCPDADEYAITDLGALAGVHDSFGYATNENGEAAGYDEDGSDDESAWYWDGSSLTSLGTLGGSTSAAFGINEAGMVVGRADTAGGDGHAFTWTSGGGMTDLGTVGGRSDSEAFAVNANGQVVGTALDAGNPADSRVAFLYLPGAAYGLPAGMNSLGTLGGSESEAYDINDAGQVVGGAQEASRNMYPFIWQSGTMTSLGTLGGDSMLILHAAYAINDVGQVVGLSYTAGGDAHAFLWQAPGPMSDLGTLPGGDTSWALGINHRGQVVGTSNVTGGDFRAFVYENGTMSDLNDLVDPASGWVLIRALDINDDGDIVGWGTDPGGDTRAFLLTRTCFQSAAVSLKMVLAGAAGTSNAAGTWSAEAVDATGRVLADFQVVDADPGASFALRVSAATPDSSGAPGPGAGTFAGFAHGLGLDRTLAVETSAPPGTFQVTVGMRFSRQELAEEGLDLPGSALHVLDELAGPEPGAWSPAGIHVGESPPTGRVGDSGFFVDADDIVTFWAVRDRMGIFAVGALGEGIANEDDAGPSSSPVPPMCGVGLLPLWPVGLASLLVTRAHRSRRRSFPPA